MGKCCQCLTELSAHDMITVGYYSLLRCCCGGGVWVDFEMIYVDCLNATSVILVGSRAAVTFRLDFVLLQSKVFDFKCKSPVNLNSVVKLSRLCYSEFIIWHIHIQISFSA